MIFLHPNALYCYSNRLAREAETLMDKNGEKCDHSRFSSIRVKICNVKEPKRKQIEIKVQCQMCYEKFPKTQQAITKTFHEMYG